MRWQRYQFDFTTRRFLVNRRQTPVGKKVCDELTEAIRATADPRPVLEHYVLEHAANIEAYEYPTYPASAMQPEAFCVLVPEDLRGIRFFQQDFSPRDPCPGCT